MENKFISLESISTKTTTNKTYNLTVKTSDKKISKIMKHYLEENMKHWNGRVNLVNSITRAKNTYSFKAREVRLLEKNSKTNEINAETVKSIMLAGMHLLDTLVNNNFTILSFDLNDFVLIDMGEKVGEKNYAVMCLFIGFDKLRSLTRNSIEIITPFKKNKFLAPEIVDIKSLPQTIEQPIKSAYYSLGKLVIYLLDTRFDHEAGTQSEAKAGAKAEAEVGAKAGTHSGAKAEAEAGAVDAAGHTFETYKKKLSPLINTKIYWMILRCMARNPNDRYLLFI